VPKTGILLKSGYFCTIDFFSMKTLANGHKYASYHNKHRSLVLVVSTSIVLNDLDPQIGVLVIFLRFSAAEE